MHAKRCKTTRKGRVQGGCSVHRCVQVHFGVLLRGPNFWLRRLKLPDKGMCFRRETSERLRNHGPLEQQTPNTADTQRREGLHRATHTIEAAGPHRETLLRREVRVPMRLGPGSAVLTSSSKCAGWVILDET